MERTSEVSESSFLGKSWFFSIEKGCDGNWYGAEVPSPKEFWARELAPLKRRLLVKASIECEGTNN